MTHEELEQLIQEVSEKIDLLPDDPEKPLTKDEKKRKWALQLQKETLERMKKAKEKGDLSLEIRAGMDYALLEKYGEKRPFLMHFLRQRVGWFGW